MSSGKTYGKMSKILITGCAGLFGAHLSRHLIAQGHTVVGFDNLQGGYKEYLPSLDLFNKLDARDAGGVNMMFDTFKPDYVYHTAAFAAVCLSPFMKNECYSNNMVGYANVVNASVNNNVKKFIHFSSMDVYGNLPCPYNELQKPQPEDTYGITKLAIELDLKTTKEQFGLDYNIIRPHNVFGIYQNIWDRYRNVLGIWIRKCLAGEDITVYGDGSQIRAFSHVKFYMDPLEKLMTKFGGEVFNIGADKAVHILEAAELVQKIAHERGYRSKIVHLEPRNEVHHAYSNHRKAKECLDFKDETDLEELVREMFVWAEGQAPRSIKKVEYEINKGLYSYWK